jgi:hypothetical protein
VSLAPLPSRCIRTQTAHLTEDRIMSPLPRYVTIALLVSMLHPAAAQEPCDKANRTIRKVATNDR